MPEDGDRALVEPPGTVGPMTATLTCDECGFDSSRWSPTDLRRTIVHAEDLAGYVLDGAGDDVLERASELAPLELSGDEAIAAHRIMHRLDVLASIRRSGEPFVAMTGTVIGLHRSGGGAPKQPVDEVVVDAGGVVGDVQATRNHHGRPWQALCLYSADVIEALRSEGHPIGPGTVGENLLIGGIDWSRLRGGLTIEVGGVRCRTSSPADPCRNIGASFVDADHRRVDHALHPGWSRWYASVLVGGSIRLGDVVAVTS